jgi:tRNA-modifying protein YgfZ
MARAKIALLADRGVVRVRGEDAGKLLQDVITNDMALLDSQPALHAALLTPQGKMLLEFFVTRSESDGGFLLETARERTGDLVKRLSLYRLRAKATIDEAADLAVAATFGDNAGAEDGIVGFPDPRLAALGRRLLAPRETLERVVEARVQDGTADRVGAEEYHAYRVGLGVPEAGLDYALGDTFPHEADLDQLNGVSFSKGCFVGQEVVSRMQHRGSQRKRVVPVEGDAPLASGSEVRAGAVAIGAVGSVAGRQGLALVRLDRAAEAVAKGEALTAGGVRLTLRRPEWASFDLAAAPARQ